MQRSNTRDRMIDSAIVVLRERGANAVTVDSVLAHSGAPRGSVYHHFPGGRDEIVLAAVERAGNFVSTRLERAVVENPALAIDTFVDFWKRMLRDSDFRAGCPIAALAVDARADLPQAEHLVQQNLARWHAALMTVYPPPLATTIVAAIEGAIILCRAQGTTDPLDDVASQLAVLTKESA